ncbi:MAG TPA: glycogen/starch/alpha-glucan phosphorylase [Casimicrobiaceae bacterium]|nr:glycogen/starch/alpha-glucan phosphorylase [Casimicrobiaceae bacterium]
MNFAVDRLTATAAAAAPPLREVEAFRTSVVTKLRYMVAKEPAYARDHDWLVAVSLAARDHVIDRWSETTARTYRDGRKRVYYFSLEFLIGRMLLDALSNLGLATIARAALADLSVDFDRLRELEPDPALGNGGLGRLAACFMESMATLGIPAHGYGIRYDHGIFRQHLVEGWQTELPEEWLNYGNPWEFERPEATLSVGFGGAMEPSVTGRVWHPAESVQAIAFDTPIPGWRGRHVNTLRLWSARAADPLRLADFNRGDHVGALGDRVRLEAISRVLYPSDETAAGQDLRLRQEYFFASASLQDLIRRHNVQHGELSSLPDHIAIQLNDTHPAIAVPELIRLLVDVHRMPWDAAWMIATRVFNYTNHTLLPEALETWPVAMLERLLPRHVEIINTINAQHLDGLRAGGCNDGRLLSSVSLIDEVGERRVRMGHLAFLGAHRVNGVSALHTDLMRETVFNDFHRLYPARIVNKTNGITFRRWLFEANPGLTALLVETAGPTILDDANALAEFARFVDDGEVRAHFMRLRRDNKIRLARIVAQRTGMSLDPDALFDVQVKRIHEYKRQLLNVLETIALYHAMRDDPTRGWVPRVKIFAGKAAAGYRQAKLVIKLIHDVARTINADPAVNGLLNVVFLPNYNVSLAEAIMPAADLSEQISTAGMEASGTGNMKLALNGALTIGTLDGANIEIRERVGADHFVLFGMTADDVAARRRNGLDMTDVIATQPDLARALHALATGAFSLDDPSRFTAFVDRLRTHDYFMVCADFASYAAAQRAVDERWRDPDGWWRSAILNTARVGYFSSDRTIRDYAGDIWGLVPAH